MKKMKWVTITILLLLMASAALPAFAAGDNVIVTIWNKSDREVTVTLSGPQRYSFTVKSGRTRVDMAPGDYNYFFYGCNQYNYGDFKAKSPKSTLALDCDDPAAGVPHLVELKVSNRSGETTYISLSGTAYYYLTAEPGVSTFLVKEGAYNYAYTVCGSRAYDEINVSGRSTLHKIDKCDAGSGRPVFRVRVINRTEGDLTLYLWGPEYYVYTLAQGESAIQIVGNNTYNYTVVATCDNVRQAIETGTQRVYRKFTWSWYCR